MLETLDIIIAFAVIMSVLSLCITIIVQMVSAALALRGKNLANALALTFQTIDPKIGEHAQDLATRILKDPIFSDSIWTRKSRNPLTPVQAKIIGEERDVIAAAKKKAAAEAKLKEVQEKLVGVTAALVQATPASAEHLALTQRQALLQGEEGDAQTEVRNTGQALTTAQGVLTNNQDYQTFLDKLTAVRTVEAAEETAADKVKVEKSSASTGKAALDQAKAELLDAQNAVKNARQAADAAAAKLELPARTLDGRTEPWYMWTLRQKPMTMGAAIRPGEVYRILHEWSEMTESEKNVFGIPDKVGQSAETLLKALGMPDSRAQEARQKLDAVVKIADLFTTPAQKEAVLSAVTEFGATVEVATTQAYDRFQRWFGSAQDRAEQWFTAHTRIISIVSGVAIALLLQLDTLEIFRTLRSQPEVVKALVEKAAPVVLAEGQKVLDPANTPAFHTYELWLDNHPLYPLAMLPAAPTVEGYGQAIRERVEGKADAQYLLASYDAEFEKATKAATKPDAATEAMTAYGKWKETFPAYVLQAEPDAKIARKETIKEAIKQRAEVLNKEALAGDEEAQKAVRAQWVTDYAALFSSGSKRFIQGGRESYSSLTAAVEAAGFDVMPKKFFKRWEKEPGMLALDHWLGMAITAGLLSLGAPFWFNLLKNLMNLRPAVAKLVEKRPNSAPALPQEPHTK